MGEVEPQAIRRHQRAGLFDMRPQGFPQNGMQDVGCRMIAGGRLASPEIHRQPDRVVLGDAPLGNATFVNDQTGGIFYGFMNIHLQSIAFRGADGADVAGLSPGLPVKRRRFGHDLHGIAGGCGLGRVSVLDQQQHAAVGGQTVVALEFRLEPFSGQCSIGFTGGAESRHGTRLFALVCHGRIKSVHVQRQAFIAHHVPHDVHRKPERVIEFEDDLSRHHAIAFGAQFLERVVQHPQAMIEGFGKADLLVFNHAGDVGVRFAQFRIGRLHDAHDLPGCIVQERLGQTDVAAVANGPSHDASQHIAPTFVGGQHPVADEEGSGPAVVGDHFHGDPGGVGFAHRTAGQFLGPLDNGKNQIRVEVGGHILQDGSNALEPQSRVNAGFGQGLHFPRDVAVELHEDQVPDFKKPVAIAIDAAVGVVQVAGAAAVQMNLRAGPAGARIAHSPEVVFLPQAHDAVFGNADQIAPEIVGLVVIEVNRHPELVGGQTVAVGQEVPGELNGFFLEIVAEGEVSQHFKEGVMARRVAHVFEVIVLAAGPHAFLGGHRTVVIPLFFAEKRTLELDHAGIGEQQGRVVRRHQGRTPYLLMLVFGKIVQKELPCFISRHNSISLILTRKGAFLPHYDWDHPLAASPSSSGAFSKPSFWRMRFKTSV